MEENKELPPNIRSHDEGSLPSQIARSIRRYLGIKKSSTSKEAKEPQSLNSEQVRGISSPYLTRLLTLTGLAPNGLPKKVGGISIQTGEIDQMGHMLNPTGSFVITFEQQLIEDSVAFSYHLSYKKGLYEPEFYLTYLKDKRTRSEPSIDDIFNEELMGIAIRLTKWKAMKRVKDVQTGKIIKWEEEISSENDRINLFLQEKFKKKMADGREVEEYVVKKSLKTTEVVIDLGSKTRTPRLLELVRGERHIDDFPERKPPWKLIYTEEDLKPLQVAAEGITDFLIRNGIIQETAEGTITIPKLDQGDIARSPTPKSLVDR